MNYYIASNYQSDLHRDTKMEIINNISNMNNVSPSHINSKISNYYSNGNHKSRDAILSKLLDKINIADILFVLLDGDTKKSAYLENEIHYSLKYNKAIVIIKLDKINKNNYPEILKVNRNNNRFGFINYSKFFDNIDQIIKNAFTKINNPFQYTKNFRRKKKDINEK